MHPHLGRPPPGGIILSHRYPLMLLLFTGAIRRRLHWLLGLLRLPRSFSAVATPAVEELIEREMG